LPSSLSGAGAPVVAFAAIASKAPHKQSNRPSFGNYFYGGATSRRLRPGCPPPVTRPTRQTEMNMTTKIVLALALAMTALASVPASASPHHDWQVAGNCQEDLGYGRTSGWGCG
jgi:hypothetical protein